MTRKMIVLVGALMLVASACAAGDDTTQAGEALVLAMPPTTSVSSVDSVAETDDAMSEGIQVHGHWTIEVRNANGTLDERREFENALITSGEDLLLRVLAQQATPGELSIALNDASCAGGGIGSLCIDPVLSLRESAGTAYALDLSGNYTFFADTSITSVATRWYTCDPVMETEFCVDPGASPEFLTRKNISSVAVDAHQTVYVTVRLSFS